MVYTSMLPPLLLVLMEQAVQISMLELGVACSVILPLATAYIFQQMKIQVGIQ